MGSRAWKNWVEPSRNPSALIPLFPIAGFFRPECPCPHRDAHLPDGSPFVCMVCHGTAVDGHASLKITATDRLREKNWEPEGGKDQWGRTVDATVYEGGPKAKDVASTRKQRRAATYGVGRQRITIPGGASLG